MPLYDYHCRSCGHWVYDQWFQLYSEAPKGLRCSVCDGWLEKMPGIPRVYGPWHERPPIDGAHNIFEGTKLADSDGKNRVHYKAKKKQIDMGAKHG